MRLIDADALKDPLELQRASYARIGATERAEAYANCLWEIAQAPTIGGWISVKDRLPPQDETVIVAINDEHGDTPFRYTYFGWYLSDGKCWIVDDSATIDVYAWMPLPEPPKENEDD